MITPSTSQARAVVSWVLALIACCGIAAAPAQAQFRSLSAAERVQVGQRANLFAVWDSRSAVDGMLVELPAGWMMAQAVALHNGYQQIPLAITRYPRQPNAYLLSAGKSLRGYYEFMLQVETGGSAGQVSWSIAPFEHVERQGRTRVVVRSGYRTTGSTRQVFPRLAPDNRVLAFRGEGPPLLLRPAALPDLGTNGAYTVEFWLRTTDVDEVVLSTWQGDEQQSYPLELVVDAGGYLAYYRGRPGQHQSMRSDQPVADGQWHHIALIHDGAAGWTRLLRDGTAADSLYDPAASHIDLGASVALGGRIPDTEATSNRKVQYTGLLDELRFWPEARTPALVRRTMRQAMTTERSGPVVFSFNTAISSRLVQSPSPRTDRVASDLMFFYPVRNLQAVPEADGVLLQWETQDVNTEAFVIERSADGESFEPVGTVQASVGAASSGVAAFSFRDPEAPGQVVFYRVRQRFAGGTTRLSGSIKIGMGPEEVAEVTLVDTFPNPFTTSTTIRYQVERAQQVRVSVWDLSGQLVASLVNEVKEPGTYQTRFNASDLPSGAYFIRLQTASGAQSRQVILTK